MPYSEKAWKSPRDLAAKYVLSMPVKWRVVNSDDQARYCAFQVSRRMSEGGRLYF